MKNENIIIIFFVSAFLIILITLTSIKGFIKNEKFNENDAIIHAEDLENIYDFVSDIMESAIVFAHEDFGSSVDSDAIILRPAVERAFTPADMLERARHDLKAVDSGDTDFSPFITAAKALARIRQQVKAEREVDAEKVLKEANAVYEQHPDKERLQALGHAMAITDLHVELALLGRRLQEAAALRHLYKPEAWKNLDQAGQEDFVRHFIQRTREEGDVAYSLFRDGSTRARASIWLLVVLVRLPEPELKTLEHFYMSETGKLKRAALVRAFAAQIDTDTREMMIDYLHQLR